MARYFTKLDQRNAYHLVCICKGDKWKTAFHTSLGHFEYSVMPFGLINAPDVFQTLVNDIVRDMLNRFLFVYIDDILIFSETLEENVQYVCLVLRWLLEKKLCVKVKKSDSTLRPSPFLVSSCSGGSCCPIPQKWAPWRIGPSRPSANICSIWGSQIFIMEGGTHDSSKRRGQTFLNWRLCSCPPLFFPIQIPVIPVRLMPRMWATVQCCNYVMSRTRSFIPTPVSVGICL